MPHFSFTSNFSYSSNGVTIYDVDPISLVQYNDAADLETNGLTVFSNPTNQAVQDVFNDLAFARKQIKAFLVGTINANAAPVLNSIHTHGFFNLCAFTPEGTNNRVHIAFNTTNNNQVENFCCDVDFDNPRRAGGSHNTNGIVYRQIATANNCLHYPDLAQKIGVPVVFCQANQIGAYDETKLIKYPKKDQSSFVQTTSGRYPEILPPAGINEHHHISVVSDKTAYYYTRGSGTSDYLRVIKIPYSTSGINASANNNGAIAFTEYVVSVRPNQASGTMWVDLDNNLFVSHGDQVIKISPVLPERERWDTNAFQTGQTFNIVPNTINGYTYVIERAVFHKKTGKHFGLCSKIPLNVPKVISDTTQYFCEIGFSPVNNEVYIIELNSTPIPISANDNKHINIPIFSDFAVFTCTDPSLSCCDLNTFALKPLTTFIEFDDNSFWTQQDRYVVSVTQPTIDSASNYLTVLNGNTYSIWKLKSLVKNY